MADVTLDVTSDTERRKEHRFLVNEAVARLALRTSGTYLSLDREDRPYQWSTTTYLDTHDWRIFRSAEGSGNALQLRIREYHRTRPGEILGGESVFLEMKDDSVGESFKERYAVRTSQIPAYLRGEEKLPNDANGLVERANEMIARVVQPVVVTQYNRIAYSAPDQSMRITADHNLMYLAVPWVSNDAPMPTKLGPVIAREPAVVIEVKWYEQLPHWADELYAYIRGHMVNERPSKFVVAMRHLLGEPQKGIDD